MQTFWTTVGLIATALVIITPLAHRAVGAPPQQRPAVVLAGVLAALSFTIDSGAAAGAMTLPWLGLGAVFALTELRSTGARTVIRHPNTIVLGPLATWAWMTAGAAWLTAHRLGLEPLGFDRAITLLTVGHFHVAGLGLTALLSITHRLRPRRALLTAIWMHQAGMVMVAAGITFSDHLEVVGAAVITVALAIWAAGIVRWICDGLHRPARVLLAVAASAWILPMTLALGWALGPFLPEPVVTTFITMLRFHAALQTFGLVLCGLSGVLLAETASTPRATSPSITTTKEDRDALADRTHT